jgi:hypothetical protein
MSSDSLPLIDTIAGAPIVANTAIIDRGDALRPFIALDRRRESEAATNDRKAIQRIAHRADLAGVRLAASRVQGDLLATSPPPARADPLRCASFSCSPTTASLRAPARHTPRAVAARGVKPPRAPAVVGLAAIRPYATEPPITASQMSA